MNGAGLASPQFAPGSFGANTNAAGWEAILAAARAQSQQQSQGQNQNQQQGQAQHHLAHRSSDSALAGALGPMSHATFYGDEAAHDQRDARLTMGMKKEEDERERDLAMTGGVAAFNVDDMEMDDASAQPLSHHSHAQQYHASPVSSSGSPASSIGSGSRSATGSPEAVPSGLVSSGSTHQQHHPSYVNGIGNGIGNTNAGASAVSSPPDTPLLATPISPLATTFQPHSQNPQQSQQHQGQGQQGQQFPWSAQAGDGGVTPIATAQQQQQQATGPAAFESFHVPAKQSGFGGASFSSFMYPQGTNGFFTSNGSNGQIFARKGVQQSSIYSALRAGGPHHGGAAGVGMNGYAGYEQFSSELPGTLAPTSGSMMGLGLGNLGLTSNGSGNGDASAIQPAMLFGSNGMFEMDMPVNGRGAQTAPCSELNTPSTSRAGSPTGGKRSRSKDSGMPSASSSSSAIASSSSNASSSTAGLQASTTLSRPGAALLLSKPFKCPKPGCMKSYKQANGLKYHMTHGQCSFTPPPEYESLQGLTEREAERKLRPYCCQVPPCQRRYKNMNGLRYHYQHSGEHGAIGLRMLAEGRHDAMKSHDLDDEEVEREERRRGSASGAGMMVDTNTTTSSVPPTPTSLCMDSPMSVTATSIAAGYPSHPHSQAQNQPQNQNTTANPMSAPPTPSHARFPSTAWAQSQPPSAYASPWTSPRSSPPLAQQAHMMMQQQWIDTVGMVGGSS